MGNCLVGGAHHTSTGDQQSSTRVITPTGAILEFNSPITASRITSEFPGHAIFPSHDLFWTPLSPHDNLLPGNSYYLLQIPNPSSSIRCSRASSYSSHARSKSSPASSCPMTPYRMSMDWAKRPYTEAFSLSSSVSSSTGSRVGGGGGVFWKVKLVISPDQLAKILSQEGSTHDLVHNVSTVAKCGGYSNLGSSASASSSSSSSASCSSDDWVEAAMSTKSSRNGCSKKDHRRGLLDFTVPS
ncbi:hypothetical protein LINPERPRIM_LOCUS24259 [Linum perenne]